jgi:hypothetical protein
VIAISEDRELANGRAHAREAQGQADSGAACGALAHRCGAAQGPWGMKDAACGYSCPDSKAGSAFLSTPVQNDPVQWAQTTVPKLTSNIFRMVNPSDRRQKLNLAPKVMQTGLLKLSRVVSHHY